jgi:hypothetical protein
LPYNFPYTTATSAPVHIIIKCHPSVQQNYARFRYETGIYITCLEIHTTGVASNNDDDCNRNNEDNISKIVQNVETIYGLFISANSSARFGGYLHPSSGAHVTVSTASGISVTVTATCS